MHDEQATSIFTVNQIIALVVVIGLVAVLGFQLGFWAGRRNREAQTPIENSVESLFAPPDADLGEDTLDQVADQPTPGPKATELAEMQASTHVFHSAQSEQVRPNAVEASEPLGYTVQVGAFRSRASANKLAQQFRVKGYSVWVKPPFTGQLYLVWVGQFTTHEQAQNFARRLQPFLKSVGINGYRVRTTKR